MHPILMLLILLLGLYLIYWAAGYFGIPAFFQKILGIILFIIFLVRAWQVLGLPT